MELLNYVYCVTFDSSTIVLRISVLMKANNDLDAERQHYVTLLGLTQNISICYTIIAV